MIILAIETSCDDTCVAIIKASGKTKPRFQVLSNIASSQIKIHRKWGGVYPILAKREHQRNLPIVLKKALKKANFAIFNSQSLISKQIPKTKLKIPKIDAIAVAVGPGLEPCLWTGVNFARDLAQNWNLPIMPINHIEAHIVANLLPQISEISNSQFLISKQISNSPSALLRKAKRAGKFQILNYKKIFPAVCLVVSGGHTQLVLMQNIGKYKILGETRDDAAGECLDKIARILGLSYPGGPAIADKAVKYKIQDIKYKIQLPRPMIYQKNYDFSFSGLKTAVLYNWQSQSPKIRKSKKYIQAIAAETQQAIIDVLIHKTLRTAKDYRVKTIILGGGVAANEELRKQFKNKIKKEIPNSLFLIPNSKFCTDNAAMIGATAYFLWPKGKTSWQKIKAKANLRL